MDQRTIKVSFKRVKPAPLRRLRLAANERDTVNAYAAAVGWLGVLMTSRKNRGEAKRAKCHEIPADRDLEGPNLDLSPAACWGRGSV